MLVTMSDKELNRINVIQAVIDKRMRRRDAAHQLNLTERQVQRLMNRYRESGVAGLVSLRRGQLGFLAPFIRTLKNASALGLCCGRQNCDHHFPHCAVGTDPIVNESDKYSLRVEFLYQLDHIGSITTKTVEFLHQNNITVFYFHTQQIQPSLSLELPDALSINIRFVFTPASLVA